MNKSLLLLLLLFLISFSICQAQRVYKEGAYRNCVDFRNNEPFLEADFIRIKKYHRHIPLFFRFKTREPGIRRVELKQGTWGIYENGYFYLNLRRLGIANGYVQLDPKGQYLYFEAVYTKAFVHRESLARSAFNFGLLGLVVQSLIMYSREHDNRYYVLNLESGMVNLLSVMYVYKILEPFPELLEEFRQEEYIASLSTLRKYLQKVNEVKN